MEKHIHTLFTEDILAQAAAKYTMDPNSLKKIGGFENYVYGYMQTGREYVLRITHSSHRTKELVQAELDWVEYLAKNQAAVCMPVYSIHGHLVEKIPVSDEHYFLATAFERAPGRHMQAPDASDQLFREWGRTIGRMHRLTKDYLLKTSESKRPAWHEDKIFEHAKEYLPEDHWVVADKLSALTQRLKTLPQDRDGYGLIHTDIHAGNFFIHEGHITVFDFDDCSYQYFISDIAIALFYCLLSPDTPENKLAFANRFLNAFLHGYREENHLDGYWIQLLPDFLKLRELELYVVIYRSCDMNHPGPWEQNYMQGRKASIEKDVPFLGIPWDLSPFLGS